jgi:hypothetical protein
MAPKIDERIIFLPLLPPCTTFYRNAEPTGTVAPKLQERINLECGQNLPGPDFGGTLSSRNATSARTNAGARLTWQGCESLLERDPARIDKPWRHNPSAQVLVVPRR